MPHLVVSLIEKPSISKLLWFKIWFVIQSIIWGLNMSHVRISNTYSWIHAILFLDWKSEIRRRKNRSAGWALSSLGCWWWSALVLLCILPCLLEVVEVCGNCTNFWARWDPSWFDCEFFNVWWWRKSEEVATCARGAVLVWRSNGWQMHLLKLCNWTKESLTEKLCLQSS